MLLNCLKLSTSIGIYGERWKDCLWWGEYSKLKEFGEESDFITVDAFGQRGIRWNSALITKAKVWYAVCYGKRAMCPSKFRSFPWIVWDLLLIVKRRIVSTIHAYLGDMRSERGVPREAIKRTQKQTHVGIRMRIRVEWVREEDEHIISEWKGVPKKATSKNHFFQRNKIGSWSVTMMNFCCMEISSCTSSLNARH